MSLTHAGVHPATTSCCQTHADWAELTEHLLKRFPEQPRAYVIAEVDRARAAVTAFGLSTADQLETGEIIARHGLLIAGGELPDVARLDPESHVRRKKT